MFTPRYLVLKIFLLLILKMDLAEAAEYYVATYGNDANAGMVSSFWKTISKAVAVMRGGDTVYVRGGEYTEGEIWIRFDHGAGSGKYLNIVAYLNEKPIFVNGDRPLIVETSYVRITGLHFRNGKFMSSVSGFSHNEFINNSFAGRGYTWDAISVEGNDILVEGNVIELQGNKQGTQGHGIYLHAGSNCTIRNNRISGMSGYGIHVFDQRRSGDRPDHIRVISNVTIAGNVIFNSAERAGIIVAAQSPYARAENVRIHNNVVFGHAGNGITITDAVREVKIYNNTIYNVNTDGIDHNGKEGIYLGKGAKNIHIYNNIITLKNPGNHITVSQATGVSAEHNLYWPKPLRLDGIADAKAIVADPQFVNAGANDFSLAASSPAIEAGINVGLAHRGSAPDLGAFEHDKAAKKK
jgi:parallel beta-helix repeat protein